MEFLAKIFDITKLPSKFFAWVSLLSGIYVFLPKDAIQKLNLGGFPPEYKAYAGVALVASLSFLCINLSIWLWNSLTGAWKRRGYKKGVAKSLQDLDRDEVAVLREFFIQGRHVIELPIDHPAVTGLINKHVVRVTGNAGYRDIAGSVFPVRLSDVAKSLVTADLLSIPLQPTGQDENRIRNERPNFIRQIEKVDQLRGGMFW